MKHFVIAQLGLAAWLAAGCERPAADGARRGAAEPAAEPEMVGPGVVSTDASEFGVSLPASGAEIYFNRVDGTGPPRVFRAVRTRDGWGPATVVPLVDGAAAIDPFVTANGDRLFFSSDAPTISDDTVADMNTWVARRQGEGWSAARPLPGPLNSDADEVFVSIAADGTLYFGRAETGGDRYFYTAPRVGGGYGEPLRLGIDAGAARIGNPAVAPDGSYLVFWSTIGANGGPPDLMVSCRVATGWGRPWNPGPPLNSDAAEIAPHVSADGRWLYFTSERPGVVISAPEGERPPGDIYRYPAAGFRSRCADE